MRSLRILEVSAGSPWLLTLVVVKKTLLLLYACLPSMRRGFNSRTRRHMWVEFAAGSLLCSERFFSGFSGFPLSSKTNISKFQIDTGMHGNF